LTALLNGHDGTRYPATEGILPAIVCTTSLFDGGHPCDHAIHLRLWYYSVYHFLFTLAELYEISRKSHKFADEKPGKSQFMLKRKIQKAIREYLQSDSNKILVIDGARQIGKSYIIRHEGSSLFPNYIEINMVEDRRGERVFENVKDVNDFYFRVSLVAGDRMHGKEDTLIFIDEIQAYPELLTLLKFLKDDNRYTYIVSGSQLGIALNETLSKPGGRIRKFRMYPMDFEEFLWANGVGEDAINTIRGHFEARESLDEQSHNFIMDLFRKYLLVGGLPDAVNTYLSTRNLVEVRNVQEEIHSLYQDQ